MDDLTGIIGQNRAIEFLRTCIDNQHLSHAYLFCGPGWCRQDDYCSSFCQYPAEEGRPRKEGFYWPIGLILICSLLNGFLTKPA